MFSYRMQQVGRKRSATRLRPEVDGLEQRLVLSTFKVNTTLDTVAVSLQNGKDANGKISLRSAIQAANARGGSNTIVVPSGTFKLTVAGAGEDASASGDLDITRNVTIKGKNSSSTIIDGNNLDRVFQIVTGKVTISNVTIKHGLVIGDGGGILNSGGVEGLAELGGDSGQSRAGIDGVRRSDRGDGR